MRRFWIVPRFLRNRWAVFCHDLAWIPVTVGLSYGLRFNFDHIPDRYVQGALAMTAVALLLQSIAFWGFGLYKCNWRYASIPDLMRIIKAVGVGAPAIALALFILTRLEGTPRSVLLLYPMLLTFGLGGPRLLYRWLKDHAWRLERADSQRALVVGAGEVAALLIRDLRRGGTTIPVALIGRHPRERGQEILGTPVAGLVDELPELIQEYQADIILVADPSATPELLRKVVALGGAAKIPCRILPTLTKLAQGHMETHLRPITVEDLLQRDPVLFDPGTLRHIYAGKRVLVTGGGGSIGAELCRQLAALGLDDLIIFEQSEFNLYAIEMEMATTHPRLPCHALLGDVREAAPVEALFARFRPQIVFHAAAYKHVPLLEDNPLEGLDNNVLGTRRIAEAAHRHGCERFVLVSTDKAVEPANLMGASKRVAELVVQGLAGQSPCAYITTRFGNVLGSVGSVVPLFQKQIAAGGPVTVTHPDISRYFMTIPEAVTLILLAGATGQGGEIFVLDMGEPVKIVDLAEQMIRLSGLEPGVDLAIRFVGLRPGEKLHEQLFHHREELTPGRHPKLLLANSRPVAWQALQHALDDLAAALARRDAAGAGEILRQLVPDYTGPWPPAPAP